MILFILGRVIGLGLRMMPVEGPMSWSGYALPYCGLVCTSNQSTTVKGNFFSDDMYITDVT